MQVGRSVHVRILFQIATLFAPEVILILFPQQAYQQVLGEREGKALGSLCSVRHDDMGRVSGGSLGSSTPFLCPCPILPTHHQREQSMSDSHVSSSGGPALPRQATKPNPTRQASQKPVWSSKERRLSLRSEHTV